MSNIGIPTITRLQTNQLSSSSEMIQCFKFRKTKTLVEQSTIQKEWHGITIKDNEEEEAS